MKILYLTALILIICSCKCKKDVNNLTENQDRTLVSKTVEMMKQPCPENGVCKVEIFKNQSLDIKTDEFGSIYYNKIDNSDTSIVQYSYNRNVQKGLQDASYREDIVFEIKNDVKQLSLSNADLQTVKMLYGRFCFCRGATGNYKIIAGDLNLTKTNNKVAFTLQFKNNKVPQIINNLKEEVDF